MAYRRASSPHAFVLLALAGHTLVFGAHLAGQSRPTAKPDVVTLSGSGDVVEVSLSHEGIDKYNEARVIDGFGREAAGFAVSLGATRGSERAVVVATQGAAEGRYGLELVAGRATVAVALAVTVVAADRPPEVVDVALPPAVRPGDPFAVTVLARDDRGLASVEIEWLDGRVQSSARGMEVKVPVDVPGVKPGTTQLRVSAVDAAGNRSEVRVVPVAFAEPAVVVPEGVDLVVASFTAPATVAVGEAFGSQVALRVRNDGNVAVAAGTAISVGFYVSADPAITSADRLLQGGRENLSGVLTAPLAPGGEVAVPLYPNAKISPTWPDATPPTGALWLGVVLDEYGDVQELDETNNIASQPLTVTEQGIDLVVASFTAPATVAVGQAFGSQVTLRIRNDGNVPVAAGAAISVGFYVSADPAITSADRLLQGGRENLSGVLTAPLAPGDEVAVPLYPNARISPTWPDATPPTGALWLGVVLDEYGDVQELDETNNIASQPLTVTPAAVGASAPH